LRLGSLSLLKTRTADVAEESMQFERLDISQIVAVAALALSAVVNTLGNAMLVAYRDGEKALPDAWWCAGVWRTHGAAQRQLPFARPLGNRPFSASMLRPDLAAMEPLIRDFYR
jgi:hypothetical protein